MYHFRTLELSKYLFIRNVFIFLKVNCFHLMRLTVPYYLLGKNR